MSEILKLNRQGQLLLLAVSSNVGPFTRISHGFGWRAHSIQLLKEGIISFNTFHNLKEWYMTDFYEGKEMMESEWLSLKDHFNSAKVDLEATRTLWKIL